MATTDAVCFQHQLDVISERLTIQGNRVATLKAYRYFFSLDFDVFVPELHAHDRVNDLHAGVQKFQVFRFVRRTQHIGVGGVGFLN
ncbi:hypothetical protein D3C71_1524310 [compost metagenome]